MLTNEIKGLLGACLAAAVLCGILPPIGIGIVLSRLPDMVVRSGDAGAFVRASAQPGGAFSPTVTTVTTTQGTLLTAGAFSALRNQPLVIQDSTQVGLRLCVQGVPATCVRLASGWPGPLMAVAKPPWGLTHARREHWENVVVVWLVLGILAWILSGAALGNVTDAAKKAARSRDRASHGPASGKEPP